MMQVPSTIVVLREAIDAGARLDELDTVLQAGQVAEALQQMGCSVSVLATGLDLEATLAAIGSRRPDCVFNLVESLGGHGRLVHLVPAVLESVALAFTGAGSDAMYLTSQKLLAKQWMQRHGIATPPFFSSNDPAVDPPGSTAGQWIVKSVWEHASFGLDDGCVVDSVGAAKARIEACAQRYGGEWFAEAFIDGREFNVAVLERDGQPLVLPLAEMTFIDYPEEKPKIVGYAAKWDEEAPEYHATQREFPALAATVRNHIEQCARQCWRSFDLRGYARVDLRLDAAGVPWVLEINANPCLSHNAGFAAAATQAGITYGELISQVLDAALRPNASATRKQGTLQQ
jgi:D-alanine-D-alanine ligase